MSGTRPSVLLASASDSSGGSGLQADVRVCAALGAHPLTVLTAVTAQGAATLRRVDAIDRAMLREQLAAVEELPIAAVKIGAVPTAEAVETLAEWLAGRRLPVVLDPVLATSGGGLLSDEAARRALLRCLVPIASLVTPNLPELDRLAPGERVGRDWPVAAARRLGAAAVLIKDGHGDGMECEDRLVLADRVVSFRHPRRAGAPVRGTGCALSTAIAVALATGVPIEEATRRGIDYVRDALEKARPLGDAATTL